MFDLFECIIMHGLTNPKLKANIANISFKNLDKVLVFGKGTMKSDHPVAN